MIQRIIFLTVILSFSDLVFCIDHNLDSNCSDLMDTGVLKHGSKKIFYEQEFYKIKNDPENKITKELLCLSDSNYVWAQALVASEKGRTSNHHRGGNPDIIKKIYNQAKQGGQTERLIFNISRVRVLLYDDPTITSYPDKQIFSEWMDSHAFNYQIVARLQFNWHNNPSTVINWYSGAYPRLNKLVSEGFVDAVGYYEKLNKLMPEERREAAHQRLIFLKTCNSELGWSKKIFMPHICN